MQVFVLLCLLGGVLGRAAPGSSVLGVDYNRPWFCHDIDCPKFTVVNTTDAFETRYYEAGVWVSTDVEAYAYAIAATTGFKRLFKYISGENEAGVKVPMTAPVRNRVAAGAGPFCKSSFTVSFFVPHEGQRLYNYIGGENEAGEKIPMTAPVRSRISAASGPFTKKPYTISFFVPRDQKHPPKPTSPDVYIEPQPAFTAFVSQFGGFAMDDWTISGKAKALTEELSKLGVEYEAEFFYFAGYDPPFRLTGRHNEVWIVAKESSVQQA